MGIERGISPSKRRYDARHPTVSTRLSAEQHAILDDLVRKSGVSMGKFIRRALTLEIKRENEIYHRGFKAGLSKAKEKYRVRVWCNECGGPITVLGIDMEIKVGDAVARTYNWYHRDCKPANLSDEDCELFEMEWPDAAKRVKGKRFKAKTV